MRYHTLKVCYLPAYTIENPTLEASIHRRWFAGRIQVYKASSPSWLDHPSGLAPPSAADAVCLRAIAACHPGLPPPTSCFSEARSAYSFTPLQLLLELKCLPKRSAAPGMKIWLEEWHYELAPAEAFFILRDRTLWQLLTCNWSAFDEVKAKVISLYSIERAWSGLLL